MQTGIGQYDPKKYRIGTKEAGNKRLAVVISVAQGKVGDFISQSTLAKWENPDPNAPAINVTVESKSGDEVVTVEQCVNLPQGNLVSEKMNLGKWIERYKGAPEIGQKVEIIVNPKGYWTVLL